MSSEAKWISGMGSLRAGCPEFSWKSQNCAQLMDNMLKAFQLMTAELHFRCTSYVLISTFPPTKSAMSMEESLHQE